MRKKLLYSFLLMLTVNIALAQNINLGGRDAGTKNTTVGFKAGYFEGSQENVPSSYASNSFFGYYAGVHHSEGYNNTFIGAGSGGKDSYSPMKSMKNSTFLGYNSGFSARSGIGQNVFLGANAGYSLVSGVGNVFVGYNAGYSELGSNKLYIDNSNTSTPLIYGDFDLNRLGVNTLPGAFTLNVGGPINATGLYVNGTAVTLGGGPVNPWTNNSTNINYNNGNVGIGIVSNVPNHKLDVNGTINATQFLLNGVPLTSVQWTTLGTNVYYTGAVGIGTTLTQNPNNYKLAVNGIIGAKEIKVENTSLTWPDYVFESTYELAPLSQVESFIKENKHLQNVPSTQEIEKNGHSLGEMDVILLKKIEELTLYIIELKKEIDSLKSEKK